MNSHQESQRHLPFPCALLPHVCFYPFCGSAGGSPGALLRTQINGTCCNAGSRHLRPFSPLLTPTHPLNSSSILTNCSNDQVALPGRGKMAGPVPRHTRAALFTPCSVLRAPAAVLRARSTHGPRRLLSRRPTQAGRCGARKHSLLSVLKLEAKSRQKPMERLSRECVPVQPPGFAAGAGRAAAAFPGSPCHTIPIFLVSINSGKIFKYTKA